MSGQRPTRQTRRLRGAILSVAVLLASGTLGGWAPEANAQTSAQIANSADGVRLRSEPAYDGSTIGLLPASAGVGLRTDELDTVYDPDGQTRWWPVSTDLGDGWVAGFFLELPGWEGAGTAAETGRESPQGSAGGTSETAAEYVPDGSPLARIGEPDGVNLRAEPGVGGEVVRPLSFDETVALRIDLLDTVYLDGSRWWPVAVGDAEGWVSGAYLAPAASSAEVAALDPAPEADAAPAPVAPEPPAQTPGSGLVGYVQVVTDDGGGLNIRADGAPDAERIGSVFEKNVVQVMEGPQADPLGNPWYLITDGETTGWVFGDFLRPARQPPGPDGDPVPVRELMVAAVAAGAATGSFMYPVERFQFTQGFGCSAYPWFYAYDAFAGCNVHDGIDLAAAMYTPVLAADGGVVDQAGWCDCGLGYYVKLDHRNGFTTVYGHLADLPPVAPGQPVTKGSTIGSMGSTGTSTGPHVHFSMQLDGVTQDPMSYLP